MPMTLRLSETDEVALREVADHDRRNMTEEIVALVRRRHEEITTDRDRAAVRAALRAAYLRIEDEDAAALELLSR